MNGCSAKSENRHSILEVDNDGNRLKSTSIGITIEPTIFLYYLALNISNFVGNNLLLRKACDPNSEIGDNLDVKCPIEQQAQRHVASINSWKTPLLIFLSTVVVLLMGVWTDRVRKRTYMLYLPIVGHIITDLACSLNVYFWNWKPEFLALFESIIPGITGHRNSVWIGSICFISDNTSVRDRTLRIGILNAIYYFCAPIGSGIAGTMNVKIGFMNTFFLCALLNLIGLVLLKLLVKTETTDQPSGYSVTDKTGTRRHLLAEICSSYRVLFKRRIGQRQLIIIFMSIIQAISISRIIGESSVMYLFVRRKFNWNEVDYSVYTAYKMVTILVGTLFSIGLLSHCLKINDALVGTIGTSVDTVAAVLYFLVSAPWQMYIIPIVDMFHGAALTLAASISTKCVESNELGKLNTIQAVLSALFPIMISPIYSQVYNLTLERMASSFFIISTIISVPTILLFGIVYCKSKQREAFSEGINYDAANVEQSNKQIPANATELPVASTVIGRN